MCLPSRKQRLTPSRSVNVEVSGLARVNPSDLETARESALLETIPASDSAAIRDWLGLAYPERALGPGSPTMVTFEN